MLRVVMTIMLMFLLVGCATDEQQWEEATRVDTIAAYEDFLMHNPKSQYGPNANRRLTVLREEQVWEVLREADDADVLEGYLAMNPDFRYATEARQRLEILGEARDWAEAQRADDIGAYETFLVQHPGGSSAPEAQRRLRKRRHEDAIEQWTVAAFEAFLGRYPEGPDAEELRARLPAVKGLAKSVALAQAVMKHAPHTTVGLEGFRVTEQVTERSDPTASDLAGLRALLADGADPNAVRIAGFEAASQKQLGGGAVLHSTGKPGRVVRSELGGTTILEYCRANGLESIAELLVEFGAK